MCGDGVGGVYAGMCVVECVVMVLVVIVSVLVCECAWLSVW